MIPVKGHQSLFRDEKSNAIVNTDKTAYQNYLNTRRVNSDKQQEIDDMKHEIEELKSLLNELVSKIASK